MDATETRVTADDRLRKLAAWCTVRPPKTPNALTAVESGNQPDLRDFHMAGPDQSPLRTTLPLEAPNSNMANIMVFANWEICKVRYSRYKKLIEENLVELQRLASLYDYKPEWLDDPNTQPEYPANQTPEWEQYDKARRRRRALLDVRNEAMRRIMGILKAAHGGSNGTDYKVLRDEGFIKVIADQQDQDIVDELSKKDRVFQASQPGADPSVDFSQMSRSDARRARREQAQAKETAKTGNPRDEIKEFSVFEQLQDMRTALLDLVDTQGNDRLKDFIYADIVSYMANGEKSASVYRNYVFMGPSGVGKTTWAGLMGKVYKASGIYMYGNVTVTMANDYVGRYIGQSGPQTKAKLDTNLENIVLIDEAYQITDGSGGEGGNYGDEVIGTLVDYMDKNIGLLMIIIAGYEDKMKKSFLQANEGLDRRFPNKFVFPSYEAEEMVNILERKLRPRAGDAAPPKGTSPAFAPGTPGVPSQPTPGPFGAKWDPAAFDQLTSLIDLGKVAEEEVERARKANTEPSPEWTARVVVWHRELFGKQGGSMENIAAKMNVYMALPEKKPSHSSRPLYTYATDMTVILQSLLDFEKWKTQLKDRRSELVQYLLSPVATNLASNKFYEYEDQLM